MTDIIFGNGNNIISTESFQLDVTHKKDGNFKKYNDIEKIIISSVDLPGLSDNKSEGTK
jgi:hypothetical protein